MADWTQGKRNRYHHFERNGRYYFLSLYRNKFAMPDNSRFITMYQFNLDKVKWLQGCVKTMSTFEELKQEEKIEGNQFDYAFDDIVKVIFGFIEQAEGSLTMVCTSWILISCSKGFYYACYFICFTLNKFVWYN